MAVRFRYALGTDLGTVRTNNEDSALASDRLLVLADGMGGHAAGEVASAVALRVFGELVGDDGARPADGTVDEAIVQAGRRTRRALHAMSEADPQLESMGTTLIAVACEGDQVTVGHIGDSRLYALREDALYQVTTDHTHVQRLIDTGQLTPERARTHPYRSMLLKSLDDQPAGADLDVIDCELHPGDRLLLCSDGLSDYLSPEDIGSLLSTADLDEAMHRLIDAALAVGTRDNVTVVVADLTDDDATSRGASPAAVVGAASEPIDLSTDAAAALRSSLPDLPLDSTAPMAGVTRTLSGEPGEPDETDEVHGLDDPADLDDLNDPAEPDSSDRPEGAAVGEEPGEGQDQRPLAEHPSTPGEAAVPTGVTPSRLPAALAALAVLAIAVALWIILG
ncbi:protein phosphatase 2C domain-containing protein [Ruania suaedae]|uniref:PP2C family protein-serine/threonine phosphatase n=1 Tax=Ruania suaedae TaxID=2897774 RepID=UPI001E434164|nr:protein phosphatase 2C domain-containing protein [Ruania suaedae]UFU02920.1 protein phosphatase 2C domain-containing protein [Ruania suaedae]